jgi:hypothetical protein
MGRAETMSPWEWYAGSPGEYSYNIVCGEPSREAVIRAALREISTGDTFQIIEARSSTSVKHEGSDCVPFLRTRNHEVLVADPALLDALETKE